MRNYKNRDEENMHLFELKSTSTLVFSAGAHNLCVSVAFHLCSLPASIIYNTNIAVYDIMPISCGRLNI